MPGDGLSVNVLVRNGISANSERKGTMSATGSKIHPEGNQTRVAGSQPERAGDSATHSVTENSMNPTKSRSSPVRRPTTKPLSNPSAQRKASSLSAEMTMKLENEFAQKKKRYILLKKQLTDKQKTAQDLYNDMSQLREKVVSGGARDPGKLEELKIEIGPIKPASSPPTDSPDQVSSIAETDADLEKYATTSEFMQSFETRLNEVPQKSYTLCADALEKHSAFLEFAVSCLKNVTQENNEVRVSSVEIINQLETHQKENESLKARLNETKRGQTEWASELAKNTYGLYSEYQKYRGKWKQLIGMDGQKDNQLQSNAAMQELQAEREKNNQTKERLRQVEVQLQKARTKTRELEAHVASDQMKIQQLQGNVKSLENQVKQKEQGMDQRVKDMQKTMKNSNSLVAKVEQQRDGFESRLVELKEKMSAKESDAMNTIKQLSGKLEAIGAEINSEKEKRQQAEEALAEMEQRYKHLEEKSQQLCELAQKAKDFTVTDDSHTNNEVRLYNELKAVRAELQESREKYCQLQKEKDDIVTVMHQAASRDDEEGSGEKLLAELVYKTHELQNVLAECNELKRVAKKAQERNGYLGKQLSELQSWIRAQMEEGGNAALGAHTIELQQQVSDLRNNLAEISRQKEELETALTQKQLEVEERDRVMREQNKILKVRNELLGLLKEKNREQSEEGSNSEYNNEDLDVIKEIAAKTEAIQELYATLEVKQVQIMRLEKMVKLMEAQQDRAQAQRTRLENRIAQLELALQNSKEHRNKGFGIL